MRAKAESTRGYYLYGFGGSRRFAAMPDVEGIAGATVEVILVDDLAAIVSLVPLEEFDQSGLTDRLENLTWLEETTRTHEAVLQTTIDRFGWVIPARFCTVYESREAIADFLSEHKDTLLSVLERLEGKFEWGVKLMCRTDVLRAQLHGDKVGVDPAGSRSGRDYLAAKKLEHSLDVEVETAKSTAAAASHRRLADASEDHVLHVVPRSDKASDLEVAMNASYLVGADHADDFLGRVGALEKELAEQGITFSVTGPWPPYTFTRLELS
jgi:Gas vesicle synthesis protein GvpL/GvpF